MVKDYYIVRDWENDEETQEESWGGLSLMRIDHKPKYYSAIKNRKEFIKHYSYISLYNFGRIHIPFKVLKKAWKDITTDKYTWFVELIMWNYHTKELQFYGEGVKKYG